MSEEIELRIKILLTPELKALLTGSQVQIPAVTPKEGVALPEPVHQGSTILKECIECGRKYTCKAGSQAEKDGLCGLCSSQKREPR